ncbi:MAG: hypothetical protein DRQ49_05600 [Gammaproteobacteria bacterium]|nr:MAG: hypothetical protein DRQ41_09300 [Gammaproteobacteria bacterium]RKZ41299.1 MAG: hypothetical protein DRQ49_05600 [Gammaproteobacteria bacterium]RKZ74540.1 MAG: hypothetical protein DRQ57_10675 [Gammaproteobacteria bacterium]
MMTNKRITKIDLNKLTKSLYGEEAYCEHTRSGKRGWYIHKDTKLAFIGTNSTEALKSLEYLEGMDELPPLLTSSVMSRTVKLSTQPEELMEILFEKFPNTFFRESEKVRPLQRYIHKKVRMAFNGEYTKNEVSAAIALYTQNRNYCKTVMKGGQRIDLEGNPCEEISQQHIKDAKARFVGEKPMRSAKIKKQKSPKESLAPPQLDQLVKGQMELNVKINELPTDSKTLRNTWEQFIIDSNGLHVKIAVRPRTWKKLQQANREYPLWVANIRGKLGQRITRGFELLTPGIQIFEKTPKEPNKVLENEID